MAKPRILEDLDELNLQVNTINKYNITSATRIEDSAVTHTVNPIPTTWTQKVLGTEYTNGDYSIKASSYYLNEAFKAFDNNESTGWTTNGNSPSNILIKLPAGIYLTKIKIRYIFSSGEVSNILLRGSNDGSTWSDLYGFPTSVSVNGILNEYSINSNSLYQYYQISVSRNTSSEFTLSELQFSEYKVIPATVKHDLPNLPDTFLDYQRLIIKTPNNYNIVGVTANTINNINIDTILYPDRYYELKYKDSKFTAMEVV